MAADPTRSRIRLFAASRHNLVDDVYNAIRGSLMDGVLAPDARLNIDQLAAELEVSATPVREALARLESDELVRKLPHRGYRVAPLPTLEQLMDLFDFRELIEPFAAGRAASLLDHDGGRLLVDEMKRGREAHVGESFTDYQTSFLHDVRLHEAVTRLAGSDQLSSALARTHSHLHAFRQQRRFDQNVWTRTLREHGDIVEAIIERNPDRASTAMIAHLSSSRTHARAMYEERNRR